MGKLCWRSIVIFKMMALENIQLKYSKVLMTLSRMELLSIRAWFSNLTRMTNP